MTKGFSIKTLIIVSIITAIFVGVVSYKVFGPSVERTVTEQVLLKEGKIYKAKVISIMDTGKRQERHPQINFKLEMRPENGDSFIVEVTSFVSVYQLAELVPGALIRVKYDHKYPQAAVILE